jgi:hypothetical protein
MKTEVGRRKSEEDIDFSNSFCSFYFGLLTSDFGPVFY